MSFLDKIAEKFGGDETISTSQYDEDEQQTKEPVEKPNIFGNLKEKFKNRPKKQSTKDEQQMLDEEEVEDDDSDVLEMLNIQPNFVLEKNILIPDDLKKISFNYEMPKGYDIGEVETFKDAVKVSINKYTELLNTRNEDVARLATIVDRLQVDMKNLQFEQQMLEAERNDLREEKAELEKTVEKLKASQQQQDDVSFSLPKLDDLNKENINLESF